MKDLPTIRIEDLKENARYRGLMRRHTASEKERMVASYRAHGPDAHPVVINEKREVIDGYGSIDAAAAAGHEKVPVYMVEGLTPDQEAKLALDLNVARRQLTGAQVRALQTAERGEKAQPGKGGHQRRRGTNVPDVPEPATRKEADQAEAAATGKTEAATKKARQRREAKAGGGGKPKKKPKTIRRKHPVDNVVLKTLDMLKGLGDSARSWENISEGVRVRTCKELPGYIRMLQKLQKEVSP